MRAQPKPKTVTERRFDAEAKKETAKNVKRSKAQDTKHGINGRG